LTDRLATILGCLFLCAGTLSCEPAQTNGAVYDSNPNHLWNRLNGALFVRTAEDGKTFGPGELDILYWPTTKHLLAEPSHHEALAVLDEFVSAHGENLIRDPLKRALLQRDLWELFDWSTRSMGNWGKNRELFGWSAKDSGISDPAQRIRDLQSCLVVLIRRLALTTNEIALLPDNYAQAQKNNLPDLPRQLFETNGDWVSVGINGYGSEPVAPTHVSSFDGHSAFCVMLHLPEGRPAALAYLDRLRTFARDEHVWIYQTNRIAWAFTNAPRETLELSSKLPQFPVDTEWALVRRMCVIDTEGRMQPTPITESIQLRRYLQIKLIYQVDQDAQKFFQFELDPRQNGALRAIGAKERGFPFVHFQSQGIDLFELSFRDSASNQPPRDSAKIQNTVLETCFTCHNSPGVFSVLSYTGFLSPPPSQRPVDLAPVDIAREASATISWKYRQFSWGLLQGLWRQADQK
jgi:hypothetical protein